MEIFITAVAILQVMAISLGVGSSTLAVLNFFIAIKDGKIDDTERHFMGVTYTVLRIAMILILISTLILAYYGFSTAGLEYFTHYIIAQFSLVLLLFINATLMTLHIMPSSFGPAIQASSWYALGFNLALLTVGDTSISFLAYGFIYLVMFMVAYGVINGVMAHLKDKREREGTTA